MKHEVKVLMTEFVTHDVKRFVIEKPGGYKFEPGQATDVSLNKIGWKGEERPFTFTSTNDDLVLEFTIKQYPEHNGVTKRLHELKPGDEIIIRRVWGTINYKGKGTFIAGGAGVTPFIAIIRQLNKEGKLEGNSFIFSNKMQKDIILEKEFREMFGSNAIFTLTQEEKTGYEKGRVDKEFLKKHIKDFGQHFYVCGPPEFVKSIKKDLKDLGVEADSLIFER